MRVLQTYQGRGEFQSHNPGEDLSGGFGEGVAQNFGYPQSYAVGNIFYDQRQPAGSSLTPINPTLEEEGRRVNGSRISELGNEYNSPHP